MPEKYLVEKLIDKNAIWINEMKMVEQLLKT